MYQTNKFSYINERWRNTKIFYVSVIIQTFIRMTTYALLTFAVQESQRGYPLIVLMRSVPDTLFFINYALLIYQTLSTFYHSHMENRLHISLLSHFTRPKFRTARKLLIAMMVGWLGFMAVIYALFFLDKITSKDVDTEFTIVNLLSATLVLVYLSYLYSKYLETPFKTKIDKKKLRTVSRVLMIWTLGRYYKGLVGLLNLSSASFLNYLSNPQQSTVGGALMFISQGVVCEIVCFYFVLSTQFINLFIEQEEATLNKTEEDEISIKSFEIETTGNRSSASFGPIIDEEDINTGVLFKKRKNGLGELLSAELMGKKVVYRRVELSRINELTLNEIKKEVEWLKSQNFNGLLHFYGAVFQEPDIGLIYPMAQNSLYKLLHEDKTIMSLKEKVKILKDIGRILCKLHEKNLFHGHLSSHNVLLFENKTPVIGDIGLDNLKKYASMVNDYTNKSVWSSPEILKEFTKSARRPIQFDDVYSYGVIVWEVITGEVPLEELTSSNFAVEISQNSKTPHIPQYFPKSLARVLKLCWAPLLCRGSMRQVYEKILLLKFGE